MYFNPCKYEVFYILQLLDVNMNDIDCRRYSVAAKLFSYLLKGEADQNPDPFMSH